MSLWEYHPLIPNPDGTPSYSLTPEEEDFLTRQNIIVRGCVDGIRLVSAAVLNTSFQEELWVNMTPTFARDGLLHESVKIVPIDASNLPPKALPESTLCPAMLRIMGFGNEQAGLIFTSWRAESKPRENRSDRDPCLIDYVVSRVYQRMDCYTTDQLLELNPRQEMTGLGLSRQCQDSILTDPDDNPKSSRDIHYWIADTMYKSYKVHVSLMKFLKGYAAIGVQSEKALEAENSRFSRVPDEHHFVTEYNAIMSSKLARRSSHVDKSGTKIAKVNPYNPNLFLGATLKRLHSEYVPMVNETPTGLKRYTYIQKGQDQTPAPEYSRRTMGEWRWEEAYKSPSTGLSNTRNPFKAPQKRRIKKEKKEKKDNQERKEKVQKV